MVGVTMLRGGATSTPLALFLLVSERLASVWCFPTCPDPVAIPECSGARSPAEYIEQLLESGYDRTKRPPCDGQSFPTGPTHVQAQFYLVGINMVDMKLGTMVLNGYMRTWWTDPRLAWNASTSCFKDISLQADEGGVIWTPDLYVDNLVMYEGKENMASLTAIYSNGGIWRSEQVLIEVKVAMDLGKLPFDSQVGKLIIASYSQDVTNIRLTARGGTIGPGKSGIGMVVAPMKNMLWNFGETEEDSTSGFDVEGDVEVRFDGSWDYLSLSVPFSRKIKFFSDQVIFPSCMLMALSYVQFFVDPNIAPARAALSVIPILIMREMINSVYSSLPEGSQRMWLSDFLSTCMFVCVAAAMQMGLVQFCIVREKRGKARLDGLKKASTVARRLVKRSSDENMGLIELCKRYAVEDIKMNRNEIEAMVRAMEKEAHEAQAHEDATADDDAVETGPKPTVVGQAMIDTKSTLMKALKVGQDGLCSMTQSSKAARADDVKESSMLFIEYAKQVFLTFDTDGSSAIDASELRGAFRFFDTYLSSYQLGEAIIMFLHDIGLSAARDPMENKLSFSQFTLMLLEIDHYKLVPSRPGRFSLRHFIEKFQMTPPSQCVDKIFRVFFPILCILVVVVFFAIIPTY